MRAGLVADLLTAEEKAALIQDIGGILGDSQTAATVTYHSMGAETWDKETGAITEAGGGTDIDDIECFRGKPDRQELKDMKFEMATDVFFIIATDIESVTPKLNDRIVDGTTTKYIHAMYLEPLGIYWKFWTGDKGNG